MTYINLAGTGRDSVYRGNYIGEIPASAQRLLFKSSVDWKAVAERKGKFDPSNTTVLPGQPLTWREAHMRPTILPYQPPQPGVVRPDVMPTAALRETLTKQRIAASNAQEASKPITKTSGSPIPEKPLTKEEQEKKDTVKKLAIGGAILAAASLLL